MHALREEGDLRFRESGLRSLISIHALREEGDSAAKYGKDFFLYISIHALREEGDAAALCNANATAISIHALREEGDCSGRARLSSGTEFLSTPSARRATPSGCSL